MNTKNIMNCARLLVLGITGVFYTFIKQYAGAVSLGNSVSHGIKIKSFELYDIEIINFMLFIM